LRSLESGALVTQSKNEFPTIKLTKTGRQIVRGQAHLDPDILRILPSKTARATSTSRAKPLPKNVDPEAVARLRDLRTALAKKHCVPSYTIFSNRTLDALAAFAPTTLKELGQIHGIGPARIEKYGDQIIAVLDRAAV